MSSIKSHRHAANPGIHPLALGAALALLGSGCVPQLAGSVAAGQRRLGEVNECLALRAQDQQARCLSEVAPFEGDVDEPAEGCFRFDGFERLPVEFVGSPSGLAVNTGSRDAAPLIDFPTARLRSEGAAPVLRALADGRYTRGCLAEATKAVASQLALWDVKPDRVVERVLRDVAAGKGPMRAEAPAEVEAIKTYRERHPRPTGEAACVGALGDRLAAAAKLPIQSTEDDREAQRRKAFFAGLKGSWRAAMGGEKATPEDLRTAAMLVYGGEPWTEKLQPEVAEKLGAGPGAWRAGVDLEPCVVRLAHRIELAAPTGAGAPVAETAGDAPAALLESASAFAKSRDEADKASEAMFARRVDVLKRRLEPMFAACLATRAAADARCESLEGLSVGEREVCRAGCRTNAERMRTQAAAAECKDSWAETAAVCGAPGDLGDAGHARCQEACQSSARAAHDTALRSAYESCWQGDGPTTCEVAAHRGYPADKLKAEVAQCSKDCGPERRERLKREAEERAEAARQAAEEAREAARQKAEEARAEAQRRAEEARRPCIASCIDEGKACLYRCPNPHALDECTAECIATKRECAQRKGCPGW